MEIQVLLTGFLVCFGSTADVNTDDQMSVNIQKNFRDLFDSVVKNDHQQSDTNRETLVRETVRERQAFDSLKSELQSAQRKKAYLTRENSRRRRDNTDENVVVPKPSAENNRRVSISTACSVPLQGTTETASDVPDDSEDIIIVQSREIGAEMKDFDKFKTMKEARVAFRLNVRAKLQAQKKSEMRGNKNTVLKIDLMRCQKYFGLLGFRTKVEDTVNEHYPLKIVNRTYEGFSTNETRYGKPEKLSYCDSIYEMLASCSHRFINDSGIMQLRENLRELGITVAQFMKKLRWIYSQFSHEVAHKIYDEVPLPEYRQTREIEERLACVGVRNDL